MKAQLYLARTPKLTRKWLGGKISSTQTTPLYKT